MQLIVYDALNVFVIVCPLCFFDLLLRLGLYRLYMYAWTVLNKIFTRHKKCDIAHVTLWYYMYMILKTSFSHEYCGIYRQEYDIEDMNEPYKYYGIPRI